MSRSTAAAIAVVIALPALAFGAPFPASSSSGFPLLSGTYVWIQHEYCQPTLTVRYADGAARDITLSAGHANLDSVDVGTLTFAQGTTPGSGTVTVGGKIADGSPFLAAAVTVSASGSAWDSPAKNSGTNNFKQTATKLTLTGGGGKMSFDIYYGKASGGVVQHAISGGMNEGQCFDDSSLDLQ